MIVLEEYEKKRNFAQTPEPRSGSRHQEPVFVIQKHAATRLHYDFRIENDGVLISWAVPKGPSTDPNEKRLAIQTEDHPLDYAGFEGIIPQGNYGAGKVLIWDEGTYENLKPKSIRECLDEGHLELFLQGKKLLGMWNLVHMKENNWLLIKGNDEFVDTKDITAEQPESVRTGVS